MMTLLASLKKLTGITDFPFIYSAIQSPFVSQKTRPILDHLNLTETSSVLDVGCGPGTNAALFLDKGVRYVGVDISEKYILAARQKFGNRARFEMMDAEKVCELNDGLFDVVILNSLLHHLDDVKAETVLETVKKVLSPDGVIHIVDLNLPAKLCFARGTALLDRGDFPRECEAWKKMFSGIYDEEVFFNFPLKLLGLNFAELVYFCGRAKQSV